MDLPLLAYYEAIDRAGAEMLTAARANDWDTVLRLESDRALLLTMLQHAAQTVEIDAGEAPAIADAQTRSQFVQQILLNDAATRCLIEPWREDLDFALLEHPGTVH